MATRNQSGNYQIVLSTKLNTNELDRQLKELNKEQNQKSIKIKVEITEKALERVKELNTLLSKTEALNNYTSALKNIQSTMQSYDKVASKVVTATKNMADSISGIGKSSQQAGNHVKSFGEKAMEAFQKFSLWSVVSGIFYKIINAAKGLIDTAIELDNAFTELSKVTDLTRDDFDKLTQQAYELGEEVAKTTTEVVNAMTEFARAGFNVEESSGILAKNALMWTNIADGTVDAAESANMIISVMKAFNIEAQGTTHIIDALNEVSNNFAVSSGQLSNSLTKSSAVLANAGVTFEQQLGLITSGTEILRNANIVSTGLRTISLRLQGMEEDGEKVDGLTAKLEKDFNQLGLTLYDDNRQMKNTYEILGDLAEVYPRLNTEQKAYYTELIAGKTRAQVAAAILNNFSRAIEATETAYNSAGSAAEENAKVLESLQGHLQALQREWESLVNSKATQDTLKFFIDLATLIVKIIKGVGGLGAALLELGTIWATLKLSKWGKSFTDVMKSVSSMTGIVNKATKAYELAGGGIKGFSAALASSQAAMAMATAGLSLLIATFGFIITKVKEAKQKHDEWIDSTLQSAETNKKNLLFLLQNIDKYKELSDKIERTSSEEEEFKSIESEIVSILGDKTDVLSRLKEGTKEYTEAVKNLTEAEIAHLTAQLYTTKNAAEDKLKSNVTPTLGEKVLTPYRTGAYGKDVGYTLLNEENMTKLGDGNKLYLKKTAESAYDYRTGKITEVQHAINVYKDYSDALEFLDKKIQELTINGKREEALNISKSKSYENISSRLGELKEGYEAWVNAEISILEISNGEDNFIIDTQAEYDNLTASIINNTEYTQVQKDILLEMIQRIYPQFANVVEESNDAIDNNSLNINKLTSNLSEELAELKLLDSAYKALSSAIDEYNANGEISISTVESLISNYSKYLGNLVNAKGELELNTTSLKKLVEAKKEDIRATIIQNAINEVEELRAKREAIIEQTSAIEDQTQKIKENNEELFKQLILEGATDDDIHKIITKAQAELALLEKATTTTSTTASKTTDKWKEAFTTAYNELKNKRDRDLIDTKTYYAELQKLNDKYFKGRTKYAEEYSKYELEIYKGMQSIFKEEIEDLNHQLTMLENQGASKEEMIAKNKEIQDKLHEQAEYYRSLELEGNQDLIDDLSEQWWKYQKNITKLQEEMQKEVKERFTDIKDAAIDTIEKQIDDLENWLDNENDLLDKRIESLKEEEDALEDQKDTEEKLLKIEEAREKLAAAKKKKVRVYREGQGFVYEDDFDAINSAQSELDELLEDWNLFQEKAKINDIIEKLEAEKKANKERVNEQIKDLNKLKEAWNKSLDLAENLDDYKGWLTKIQESESKSYNERLKALKEFVASYNAEMKSIQGTQATASSNTGSTYEPTKRGSGKDAYYVDVDYQALINEAKAQGAPEDHLASLERARNNKIDGEGLSYEKTYNYTSNPNAKSGSPNPQLTGLASGTTNADGLMHFVGENGPELYVPPKGSGIIPNPNTENLMAWSIFNPMDLVKNLANVSSDTVIDIGNISLPNVTDANSFVEELKNFKGFAIQRQSVRR